MHQRVSVIGVGITTVVSFVACSTSCFFGHETPLTGINYIKTVAEILLYPERQNNAQRGHREQDDAAAGLNKGNFLKLLNLISKHDSKIVKKIEGFNENA